MTTQYSLTYNNITVPHYSWKCSWCDCVLPSRRRLIKHKSAFHDWMMKLCVQPPGGKCRYCGKTFEYRYMLTTHEARCNENPDRIEWKSHPQTKESIEKIKKTAKMHHRMGGYRHGSGRGKKGWYKGYFCDSSWELAFVIYNIEHGIQFVRNTKTFDYVFNGDTHKYLPDFLINGSYYEIKGMKSAQWLAKVAQFPSDETLIVIDKYTIKPYIDYVVDKYGKDYINLYENKKQ